MEEKQGAEKEELAQWFYDPYQQATLRYFDGKNWTGHTMSHTMQNTGSVWSLFQTTDWTSEAIRVHRSRQHLQLTSATHRRKRVKWKTLTPIMAVFFAGVPLRALGPRLAAEATTLFLAVLTIIAFFVFLKQWNKYTLMKDTPTVEVRGAHLGVCELQGVVEPYHAPVVSWATANVCTWTHMQIDQYEKRGDNGSWKTKWSQSYGSPKFYLRDANGDRILVDVTDFDHEKWCPELDARKYTGNKRFIERGLLVGEKLFVMGTVQIDETGQLVVAKKQHPFNVVENNAPFIVEVGEEEENIKTDRITNALSAVQFYLLLGATVLVGAYAATLDVPTAAPLGIVAAIISSLTVATTMWLWRTWNRLRSIKWRITAAWSLVDVATQRRHDLIEALNEVTAQAFDHEKTVQTHIAQLRIPTPQELDATTKTLTQDERTLRQLVALQENYADMKTSENAKQLMDELEKAESQLSATRKFYNDAVTVAQTASQQFPTSFLAKLAIGEVPPLLGEHTL